MTKKKPLLILVNPTSGTKLAKTMLKDILKPELDQKHIEYELVRISNFLFNGYSSA
jgi:hypothetical protein